MDFLSNCFINIIGHHHTYPQALNLLNMAPECFQFPGMHIQKCLILITGHSIKEWRFMQQKKNLAAVCRVDSRGYIQSKMNGLLHFLPKENLKVCEVTLRG